MKNENRFTDAAEAELTAVRDSLQGQVADAVVELDDIRLQINPQLYGLWATRIGVYVVLEREAELEMRRARRKLELIQTAANREEPIEMDEVEATLTQELEEWEREIARFRAENTGRVAAFGTGEYLTLEQTAEIKSLYRTVCKRLHPDIAGDLTAMEKALLLAAQNAYEAGDLPRMRAIEVSTRYREKQPAPDPNTDITDELGLEIALLKTTLAGLLEEVSELKEAFPYSHIDLLRDEEWIVAEVGAVQRRIESHDRLRTHYEARIERITRGEQW